MHWHIDTDIISFFALSAIYIYCLQTDKKGLRDLQGRRFLNCLLAGIAVAVIDIFASVAMEVPVSAFVYHLLMTLDFLGLELAIVFWFFYGIALLYHDDPRGCRRVTHIVAATYLLYALLILTNPWTGLVYSLDANGAYQRGPLFSIMTVAYILYTLVLFFLVIRRRRHLPAGYPSYPLLITPAIVGASLATQLLTPGWLMLLPGYMLSMMIAFLFLQTRREKEHASAEQLEKIIRNVSCGICIVSFVPDGQMRMLHANDAYFDLIGYTRDQFESELMNPLDIVLTLDKDLFISQTRLVFDTGCDADFEYRIVRRDGSLRYVRNEYALTSIPGMGDAVLLATLSDITQLKLASETVRIHEQEMQLAMAQMGKMICEYSFDTDALSVPEAYAAHFEPGTEFNGTLDNAARKRSIDPAYWNAYLAFFCAIRRGDPTGLYEIRIIWADGTAHWERATFHTIFGTAGTPVKAIVALEDTTEQHARYELEQSRPSLGDESLLFRALFNLTTGEALEYAYGNGDEVPPKRRLGLSLSPGSLKGALINDDECNAFAALNNRESLLKKFEAGETELSIDYRRQLSAGDLIWVRNILRMVREPGGSDILLFEYCYDIETEKMREQMYNALVDDNYDFVGRINAANGHFVILTSSAAADALPPPSGNDLDAMVRSVAVPNAHPDDRDALLASINIKNIEAKLAHRDQYRFTYRLIRPSGDVAYKVLSLYYLDRERRIIFITREDVSVAVSDEMKKNASLTDALAAAEQANDAKTRFLSRISHELRTPMNVILGTTELATSRLHTPPAMLEACDAISTSAKYLLSLINDILEISRIEGGKLALEIAPFTLDKLLLSVNGIIEPQARSKGIDYSVTIAKNMRTAYAGDMSKLQHLLINLLDNAVKFTPASGRVQLAIEPLGRQGAYERLRFAVTDTGIGIDEAFIPHLFELFMQESAENTTTVTGTGLGLTIAKSIAELMHGCISVHSKKGSGSTFIAEVALKTAAEEIPVEAKRLDVPDLTGRRILIVEDNTMNALILSRLLAKVGAKTETAKDGQQGVDMFFDSPIDWYDAILMDIRMPVMDGLTATKCIRSMARFDARAVPIIAVSANAFDDDVALSLQSGMNAHLAKPVETIRLLTTLVRYMQQ